MAGGTDTRNHPRRRVDREGWEWGKVSGSTMHGKMVESAVHTYDPAYRHGIDITEDYSGRGYSADLEYIHGYHGRNADMEVGQYRAGPYRTQLRAKIAGRALARRVEGGRGEEYQTGGYTESAQEARWNREGLL
jgi:hypothetical protein